MDLEFKGGDKMGGEEIENLEELDKAISKAVEEAIEEDETYKRLVREDSKKEIKRKEPLIRMILKYLEKMERLPNDVIVIEVSKQRIFIGRNLFGFQKRGAPYHVLNVLTNTDKEEEIKRAFINLVDISLGFTYALEKPEATKVFRVPRDTLTIENYYL